LSGLEEKELVRRAAEEDDREAFARLISRYQNGVFGLLHRLLGGTNEVEDVAQNVFLSAYRGLRAFRGQASFGTWIYRIAYNQACSALRRLRSRRAREMPQIQDEENGRQDEPTDSKTPDPEQQTIRKQVWEAVSELPPASQAVVEMYYNQGLKYPQIAEALDLPLGTVKTHLHRARAQLREILTGA